MIKDALDNETTMEYDTMDRVIRVTDAKGAATESSYTQTGKIETITDALGGKHDISQDAIRKRVFTHGQAW